MADHRFLSPSILSLHRSRQPPACPQYSDSGKWRQERSVGLLGHILEAFTTMFIIRFPEKTNQPLTCQRPPNVCIWPHI